jgi:hypothetical protein
LASAISLYQPDTDTYACAAGECLIFWYTRQENGLTIRRYWFSACPLCPLRSQCTTRVYRRVSRWEHKAVVETAERRLDQQPERMRVRRCTVEHPFGTLKAWMGHTHFLTRTLPRVSTEMSLHGLAYNLKRVIGILGARPLIMAMSRA